ncbi:MAG: glycosyltransferase family 39 protein [Planctomycetes bacterium]|nr:glycosyltransferase family 39 protein [Planctomycetota bacterium]
MQKFCGIPLRPLVVVILLSILLLAAFLRLVNFGLSPPGLNQDEAGNAWNAYCLLKTGKDQVGQSWPVFYTHGLGGNRTTLYIYLLLPFQAIGGLNIFTTRLPSIVGGVFTVLLIFLVGKRLFGTSVGLFAAGLLALNPWHIQQSRWGHEGALCALYGIVPLAMLLWANMPVSDDKTRPPRPFLAVLAGAASGIVCYGYHAVRIFVPVFLLATVLVTFTGWWRCLKTRKGALAIAAFVVGFVVTFGPLVWHHIFDPDGIARHVQHQEMLWVNGKPLISLANIALRYIYHFNVGFLFLHGDNSVIQSPPGMGMFHWYMMPLMIAGLVSLIRRFRFSRAARILFVLILIYPIGDSFFGITYGLHALRSLPGLCGLVLMAAIGAASIATWLWKKNRATTIAIAVTFLAVVIILNVRYLRRFYGEYNRQSTVYHSYQTDFVEACQWLRPRFDEVDAVLWTTKVANQPYIITLVTLGYEPQRWFSQPRRFVTPDEFDLYTRYGKMFFVYEGFFEPELAELQKLTRQHRIVYIVRPGELDFGIPAHKIFNPDGREVLWIYDR